MASVSLKHIFKRYPGGVTAVSDFCLEIKDKEFIIFVGPSGCGKSTTLRMVAGLEDISGGTLKIDGKVMNDVEPKDRDIAMVFQNYALYPHITVYENMAFSLRLRKMDNEEVHRRVCEAAEILGIHRAYLKAGAMALKTNTYGLSEDFAFSHTVAGETMLRAGCKLAKTAAAE